jgi:hypothetical protein
MNENIPHGAAETSAGQMEVAIPAVVKNEQGGIEEIVVVAGIEESRSNAGGAFHAVAYNDDGDRISNENDPGDSPEVQFDGETHGPFAGIDAATLTTIRGRIPLGGEGAEVGIEWADGTEVLRVGADELDGVAGSRTEVLARAFTPDAVGDGDGGGVVDQQARESIAGLRAELDELESRVDESVSDGGDASSDGGRGILDWLLGR